MELSINDIYKMLLPLSPNNKLWLAEKLIENVKEQGKQEKKELVFPKIDKSEPISEKTLSLVIGTLPKDFDVQKATDEMWEEFAK